MKIALLLDDRLDVPDGVQQYVRAVGAWMERRGHTVHYLVGETGANTAGNVYGLSRTIKMRFNQNRVRIPLPVSKRRLRKFLAQQQYDIIHVQMPYAPWMSGRVIGAAPANTAVVGTFHVVVVSSVVRLLSRLVRYVTHASSRRIQRLVAVSAPAQDYMQTYLGRTGLVIPNAVEIDRFRKGHIIKEFADDKVNILFLGRLVERKGAALLLSAFSRLPNSARLIIVGDGPLRKKLEQDAKAQQNEVIFVGFIKESEKPSYLKSADIAVFPSSGGESFGIVLIEAMSAGAGVVLAGDNPGYRSVMKDVPDAMVSVDDPSMLAEQLTKYVTSKALRDDVKRQQAKLVAEFDINVIGEKLLDVYEDALQQARKVT